MAEEKEVKKKKTTKKKELKPKDAPQKKTTKKKELKPKDAPQKKVANNKPIKKAMIKPMVHIDEFLDAAKDMYDLSTMQLAGFRGFMVGKHYLSDMRAFIPYLERYLGK